MNRREEDRRNEFERYVMNDIPIRLIRLSDMSFVGRDEIREHFRKCFMHSPWLMPSDVVKYAILSHRWLNKEPTYNTFEKMKKSQVTDPGFKKLMKFCDEAKKQVDFAWSDTCCIDKSSSTELDESIRSMFRWYRNSVICIIHLAQSETIGDILQDEWTQRGWTLQELLAPLCIKFFNKRWKPMTGDLNDKRQHANTELLKTLEKATGIPHSEIYWHFDP